MRKTLSLLPGLLLLWCVNAWALGGGGSSGTSTTPSGPAGGDLTGTYPNPQVASISNSNAGTAAFLTAPAIGAITGFTALEQWQPHALPIVAGPTALTCTGTSGTFPFNDDYEGTLGAVNVTVSLPASGCSAGSLITIVATQGGSAVSFTVTGTKEGSELWSIGTASGNRITLQYQFDAANTAWQVYNPGTYPSQAFPISVGGIGTTSPSPINTKILTSGTTYTPPAGTTQLHVTILGAGGGGGAATSGGATSLSGGSGASGSYLDFWILDSLGSSYTYSIGAGGTAGTCSASPSAGGVGGSTSWTMAYPSWVASTVEAVGNLVIDSNNRIEVVISVSSDAKTGGSPPTWATAIGNTTPDNHVTWLVQNSSAQTLTATGGNGGGTASTTVAGLAGTAPSGPGTGNLGLNVAIYNASAGIAGQAGNSSSSPVLGTNKSGAGGQSASVSSGTCSATAGPGQGGSIIVQAIGAF